METSSDKLENPEKNLEDTGEAIPRRLTVLCDLLAGLERHNNVGVRDPKTTYELFSEIYEDVQRLKSPQGRDELLGRLATHLVFTDRLALLFMDKAITASRPDVQIQFATTAMKAQAQVARLGSALEVLKAQAKPLPATETLEDMRDA